MPIENGLPLSALPNTPIIPARIYGIGDNASYQFTPKQVADAGHPFATVADTAIGTALDLVINPFVLRQAISAQVAQEFAPIVEQISLASEAATEAAAQAEAAAEVAGSILTLDSYAAALAAAPALPADVRVISAIVSGREVRWARDPAGVALDGGWSPADVSTPQHYAVAAGSIGGALSRALNVSGDRVVDLGTGTYILDGETVEALHPFTLRGNGPGKTTLICRNMSGRTGVNLTLGGPYNGGVSRLEGMSIVLEGQNGGTFFRTPVGAAARSFLATYEVVNCRWHGPNMPGTTAVQFGWETALRLGDGDNHLLENCEYYGRYDPRYDPTAENAFGTFVELGGVGGEGGLAYPIIDNCRVLYAGCAVRLGGGIFARPKFDKLTVHDCWDGLISEIPLSGHYADEITLVDCDINTQRRAVHIESTSQIVAVAVDTTRAPGRFDHPLGWTGWYVGYAGSIELTHTRAADFVPSSGTPYTSPHIGYDLGGDSIIVKVRTRTSSNGRFATAMRLRSPRLANIDLTISNSGQVTNGLVIEGAAPSSSDVVITNLSAPNNVANRLVLAGGYSRSNVRDRTASPTADAAATSVSAGGAETYRPGVSSTWRRLSFAAGSGPYNYDITMSAVDARQGDEVEFTFAFPAANGTVRIYDAAGTLVYQKTGAATTTYNVKGRYVSGALLFRIVSSGINT